MISWLKYFFCGFFSNKLSRQSSRRSLGNTALGALFAFVLLVCFLTWGYQASFPLAYGKAGEFQSFVQETLTETALTVSQGKATADVVINTFLEPGEGYKLIVDTRDLDHIYDDFRLLCRSETLGEIDYETYLAQPAHIQQAYTDFAIAYTGNELNPETNWEVYRSFLTDALKEGSPAYDAQQAEAFQKLEQEKTADYYEQLYLMYVKAYYPDLGLPEVGPQAPTVEDYYMGFVSNDQTGKLLVVLRDKCYAGFESRGGIIFYAGDYSLLEKVTDGDTFIEKTFQSGQQVDYLMYAVNVFGGFLVLIAMWVILMVTVRFYCRKKGIYAGSTFGSSAQLVGSFLMGSGLVGGLLGFLLSFLVGQTATFYAVLAITVLTLLIRTVLFLVMHKPEDEKEINWR